MKTEIFEAGAKLLLEDRIQKEFTPEVRESIAKGELRFMEGNYLIRKPTKLSAIEQVLEEQDLTVDTINTFTNAKIGANKFMALTAVSIAHGFSATSVPADDVDYASSDYYNTIPKKLRNAKVVISCGNRTLLSIPASKFFARSFAENGNPNNTENKFELRKPELLKHNEVINIVIKYGNGTVPTGFHYVEVMLEGVETASRI